MYHIILRYVSHHPPCLRVIQPFHQHTHKHLVMTSSCAIVGNAAWPSSTAANNLWAPLEGGGGNAASERGTPSNLNSYLPENLLGGELN